MRSMVLGMTAGLMPPCRRQCLWVCRYSIVSQPCSIAASCKIDAGSKMI